MKNMGEYINKCKDKNIRLNDIFFWVITIDIFFLPYLSFVAISVSVLIVALWMLINIRRISETKEHSLFVIMAIFMLLGTIMNLFYSGTMRYGSTSFVSAIKRFFQYIFCFETYFFYKDYFLEHHVKISRIIFIAILYMTIFAIMFKLFPYEYATLKLSINPADNHTRRYLANEIHYRFNYLWTDPNNISYLVAGLMTWMLSRKDISLIKKMIVVIASIFTAFCTVSNSGIITLLLMGLFILLHSFYNSTRNGIDSKTVIECIAIIVLLFVTFEMTDLKNIIENNYISLFVDRINDYSSAGSISGGRLEDVISSLGYLSPIMLFIGTGNEGFVSEIGHIYWIGMYGFPAYVIFMWIMFRKEKKLSIMQYIWVIPFFMAFTMNIAIGEYKWLAIYLMLLAYSRYGDYRYIE